LPLAGDIAIFISFPLAVSETTRHDIEDYYVNELGVSTFLRDITASSTIVDDAAYNSFPGLVKVGDNLLCAYRVGSAHTGVDGVIKISSSADGGLTWGTGTTILSNATYDVRDPSLTVLASGRVVLIF